MVRQIQQHQWRSSTMNEGSHTCYQRQMSYMPPLDGKCDTHYQKIDKYKRKYRGNIFVGKFPRDFTNGNIPSIYTDGITVGKKIKTKQKKKMTCHFYQRNYRRKYQRNFSSVNSLGKLWTLFIMSITKGITDRLFRRYFPESVIWRFSEKIQLI